MSNTTPEVLLLQPCETNSTALETTLRDAGFGVLHAASDDPARALGDRKRVTVILADVSRGSERIGERLVQLMGQDAAADIPVVFLHDSGSATDNLIDTPNGLVSFSLSTPVEECDLIAVVRAANDSYVEMRKLRAELRQSSTAIGSMLTGTFQVRKLEEAHRLATFLSRAYPEPSAVEVGMLELMINAIEHGNLGIGSQEKSKLLASGTWLSEVRRRGDLDEYRDKFVTVSFERKPHEFRFTVQDQGNGFEAESLLNCTVVDPFAAHGRGIFITRTSCFTSLRYEDSGRLAIATLEHS